MLEFYTFPRNISVMTRICLQKEFQIQKNVYERMYFSFICVALNKLKGSSLNFAFNIKGVFSCLRQFLGTESSLKMMKLAFYFTLKAFLSLKTFKFMINLLVM